MRSPTYTHPLELSAVGHAHCRNKPRDRKQANQVPARPTKPASLLTKHSVQSHDSYLRFLNRFEKVPCLQPPKMEIIHRQLISTRKPSNWLGRRCRNCQIVCEFMSFCGRPTCCSMVCLQTYLLFMIRMHILVESDWKEHLGQSDSDCMHAIRYHTTRYGLIWFHIGRE